MPRIPVSLKRIPDKKLVTWKEKEKDLPKLKRNLAALMDIMPIEEGQRVPYQAFKHDAIIYIVASLIKLPESVSESDKQRLLSNACFRLPTCKRQDATTLRRVLAAGVRRHLALPVQPYRIIFPLNVDHRSLTGRRWFSVRGLRFQIRSWSYLTDHVAWDEWLQATTAYRAHVRSAVSHSFTPLEAVALGRNHQEAFDKADDAFELLRSVLNLECFGRYSTQFAAPTPLAKFRSPPICGVFREDGGFETFYFETNLARRYDPPKVSHESIRQADRLLHQFGLPRTPGSTMGLVEDAIRRYGRALDTINWPEAFLTLWQVLEVLTYKFNSNYNIRNVCERAHTLLQNDPLMTDLLDTCYEARNALVHRGRFSEDGLTGVGMLKAIVERCIDGVYKLRRVCPDWDSLVVYYKNEPAQSRHLARKKRVIGSIQRMSKASKKKDNGTKKTGTAQPTP